MVVVVGCQNKGRRRRERSGVECVDGEMRLMLTRLLL